jgi:hypothetical protein
MLQVTRCVALPLSCCKSDLPFTEHSSVIFRHIGCSIRRADGSTRRDGQLQTCVQAGGDVGLQAERRPDTGPHLRLSSNCVAESSRAGFQSVGSSAPRNCVAPDRSAVYVASLWHTVCYSTQHTFELVLRSPINTRGGQLQYKPWIVYLTLHQAELFSL